MLVYLLDANTLINAKNAHYQFTKVPEFWDWLIHQGNNGKIKIPAETYDEFKDTKRKLISSSGETTYIRDDLADWAMRTDVKEALLFDEDVDIDNLSIVMENCYLKNPTEAQVKSMGADPILISYCLIDPQNRIIISAEVSKTTQKGANRRVPDACDILNIECGDIIDLINNLEFSTDWKDKL